MGQSPRKTRWGGRPAAKKTAGKLSLPVLSSRSSVRYDGLNNLASSEEFVAEDLSQEVGGSTSAHLSVRSCEGESSGSLHAQSLCTAVTRKKRREISPCYATLWSLGP